VRMVGRIDAEIVRQGAGPFEPVEGPAAVKVDQRLTVADRVSDRFDSFDAVNDPFEAFGAVGPLDHAVPVSDCAKGGAATDGEAGQGGRRRSEEHTSELQPRE